MQRGTNPNSLENLKKGKRFEKGKAPISPGRPKTQIFRQTAIEWLDADDSRRFQIITNLAKTRPDFFAQLVDGKLVETQVIADASGDGLDNLIDALARLKARKQAETNGGVAIVPDAPTKPV